MTQAYHLKLERIEQTSQGQLEELIRTKEEKFNEIKYDSNITSMHIYQRQTELNELYKLREKLKHAK